MTDFSKAKFLEFLDFLGNKGLMNKMTVASRKAAVKTFLSILSDQEAQDVTKLDLNELAIRFSNLKGAEFKPESIKVYKSRVTTALEDFKKYRANPLSFKPTVGAPRTSGATKAEKADDQKPVVKDQKFLDDQSGIAFPVPNSAKCGSPDRWHSQRFNKERGSEDWKCNCCLGDGRRRIVSDCSPFHKGSASCAQLVPRGGAASGVIGGGIQSIVDDA